MSLILTALLYATAAPPAIDSATEPAPASSHTTKAHQRVRMDVRVKLVPHLRSYESLAQDMGAQLGFLEQIKATKRRLDSLRNSTAAKALENTIPGFRWLTVGWDALKEMVDRLELTKARIKALKQQSAKLLTAAEAYADNVNDRRFNTLMRGYMDAGKVFAEATVEFERTRNFLKNTRGKLAKARGASEKVEAVPLIGGLAEPLTTELAILEAQIGMGRAVLQIAIDALERDDKALVAVRTAINEARAHDAYDAAESLFIANRPGSALAAFRDVRFQFPDTPWAHRADRRLVSLTRHVDRLEADARGSRSRIEALTAELRQKPTVVEHIVAQPFPISAAPTARSAHPAVWFALGALTLGLLVGLRRTVRRPPPE